MTTKKLYTFYANCGRMGSLEGLFIATEEEINVVLNKTAHFGEALGKHSNISVLLTISNFTMLSDDQEKIAWLEGIMKDTVISGYNPLDYILCEYCGENREYCECALKGKDKTWICPKCQADIDQHCYGCGICFKDMEDRMNCGCH